MKWAVVAAILLAACAATTDEPSPVPTDQPTPLATAVPTLAPTATPTATLAPTAPATTPPTVDPMLQGILDRWRLTSDVPAAVVGLRFPDGRTAIIASGEADEIAGTELFANDRFRLGSITKTIVATLILQLAAAGRVDLDAELAAYLPDAPHAGKVTIRQLLDHTSGLVDFGTLRAYDFAVLRDPGRTWNAEETIDLIADQPLDFKPGTRWAYSNTGYVLLGMVAEKVTGLPLAAALRERIYEPLGLTDTYLEEEEPGPPMSVAGHIDLNRDGTAESVREIPYTALVTSGAAAGGISSTALDVLDFASGLFDGVLLDDASLHEMLTVAEPSRPDDDYGLGIARFRKAGHVAWGHGGAIPGFTTLFARADSGAIVVVLTNTSNAHLDALADDAIAATTPR